MSPRFHYMTRMGPIRVHRGPLDPIGCHIVGQSTDAERPLGAPTGLEWSRLTLIGFYSLYFCFICFKKVFIRFLLLFIVFYITLFLI